MPHRVLFQNLSQLEILVKKQEIIDLIDMLFRGKNTTFEVRAGVCPTVKSKTYRGVHEYNPFSDSHTIWLNISQIIQSGARKECMGGNRVALSPKHGACLVLAHEIQHANQSLVHRRDSSFYQGRYRTRACERDAREFADRHYDMLAEFVGIKTVAHRFDITDAAGELDQLIKNLSGLEEVSKDEIREELRRSGINNPINFGTCIHTLISSGVRIV